MSIFLLLCCKSVVHGEVAVLGGDSETELKPQHDRSQEKAGGPPETSTRSTCLSWLLVHSSCLALSGHCCLQEVFNDSHTAPGQPSINPYTGMCSYPSRLTLWWHSAETKLTALLCVQDGHTHSATMTFCPSVQVDAHSCSLAVLP